MKGIRVSTNRYLGQLKQPKSESDPLELSESDVVWSSESDPNPNSPLSSPATPRHAGHAGYYFSDHQRRLVHRKPVADPTLLAASVARVIPGHDPNGLAGSGQRKIQMSAPVNVPVWPEWMKKNGGGHWKDEEEDEDDVDDEKMVPPHELVAKSHNSTTFSVFEGVGRTLKGRDLRRVRNAIFQKTGVLE